MKMSISFHFKLSTPIFKLQYIRTVLAYKDITPHIGNLILDIAIEMAILLFKLCWAGDRKTGQTGQLQIYLLYLTNKKFYCEIHYFTFILRFYQLSYDCIISELF